MVACGGEWIDRQMDAWMEIFASDRYDDVMFFLNSSAVTQSLHSKSNNKRQLRLVEQVRTAS